MSKTLSHAKENMHADICALALDKLDSKSLFNLVGSMAFASDKNVPSDFLMSLTPTTM